MHMLGALKFCLRSEPYETLTGKEQLPCLSYPSLQSNSQMSSMNSPQKGLPNTTSNTNYFLWVREVWCGCLCVVLCFVGFLWGFDFFCLFGLGVFV